MKTGFFKTKYSAEGKKFKCTWIMILGKCFFIKNEELV